MSIDAFSGLPLQAGHAVASTVGRAARWAAGTYMRAPLRNTAVAALTTLCAMAGSNALYNQTGQHPAPMFGSFRAEPAPVMPLEKPVQLLASPAASTETTGSVNRVAEIPVKPIGNEDVFEIQRKLTAFSLFDGKVDGLYGPRTARSIRAFEEAVGRKPTGQLTPEIIEVIKATPITAQLGARSDAAVVSTPAPVTAEVKVETPVSVLEQASALPAPEPLVAAEDNSPVTIEAAPAMEPTVRAEGVTALEMTSPPAGQPVANVEAAAGPTKREVQTIAVRAPAQEEPAAAEVITTPIDVTKIATDPKMVGAVQRGLASLGFLHGQIDGVAGEATAKAIRNFEVYYNYNVTGRITPELLNLLAQNGARV